MFKDLKRKLTATFVLTGFMFIALLFVVVYLVTSYNTTQKIDDILDQVLDSEINLQSEGGTVLPSGCIIVETYYNGDVFYAGLEEYPAEVKAKLLTFATTPKKAKSEGTFDVDDYYFRYKKSTAFEGGGAQRVAFFDTSFTDELKFHLGNNLVIILLCSMAIVVFVSVKLADRIVQPTQRAWKKQTELVANASHELKTPIAIINANAGALENATDPADSKKWIKNITDQSERMSALISDMVKLAKYEADTGEIATEPVCISEILDGLGLTYEANAFEKNIDFECTIKPDVVIKSNAKLFEELAYILLDNAFKYTNEGGKIELLLKTDKKHVVFTVQNTCSGIKEEDLPKIFDRFYKCDLSHENSGKSFGLGLSIAKTIATKLNGVISAVSDGKSYLAMNVSFKQTAKDAKDVKDAKSN